MGPAIRRDLVCIVVMLLVAEFSAWTGAFAAIEGAGLARALFWISGMAAGMAVTIHRAAVLEDQTYWVKGREAFHQAQLVDKENFGDWRRL